MLLKNRMVRNIVTPSLGSRMPIAVKDSIAAHPNEWCMNKPQAIALNNKGVSTKANSKNDDVNNED